MKEIKLFKNGEIKTRDGREFTRLVGGFGDDKPIVTIKQISELLEKQQKHINEVINNNISHFTKEKGYILDIKNSVGQNDPVYDVLKSQGYSNQSISNSKNIYILSEAGFLLYLKFAEGDKAVEIYKDFLEDYFQTKAENIIMKRTLQEEIEFIKGEKAGLLGRMIMEEDEQKRIELSMKIERHSNRISELKSALDNEEIKKALESQGRLKESKKEYVNQSEFGAMFNNKMGSKTVGKLLKIVGLAKKTYSKTVPYEQYIPRYAQNDVDNDFQRNFDVSYKWNYDACVKFIDKWLNKNGLYEKFYGITNKNELTKYIGELYERLVEKSA